MKPVKMKRPWYKQVITRALGMHGIYCTQPSELRPRASVKYMPYIPSARVITITRSALLLLRKLSKAFFRDVALIILKVIKNDDYMIDVIVGDESVRVGDASVRATTKNKNSVYEDTGRHWPGMTTKSMLLKKQQHMDRSWKNESTTGADASVEASYNVASYAGLIQ